MSRAADDLNREIFTEAMEVIKLAWTQERFSHSGKHFTFPPPGIPDRRSEEHTSELQSLMRISYAVFCLKKKKNDKKNDTRSTQQETNKRNTIKHISTTR